MNLKFVQAIRGAFQTKPMEAKFKKKSKFICVTIPGEADDGSDLEGVFVNIVFEKQDDFGVWKKTRNGEHLWNLYTKGGRDQKVLLLKRWQGATKNSEAGYRYYPFDWIDAGAQFNAYTNAPAPANNNIPPSRNNGLEPSASGRIGLIYTAINTIARPERIQELCNFCLRNEWVTEEKAELFSNALTDSLEVLTATGIFTKNLERK